MIAILELTTGKRKTLYRVRSVEKVVAYVARSRSDVKTIEFFDNKIFIKKLHMRSPPKNL
jgi:hypothetical protein